MKIKEKYNLRIIVAIVILLVILFLDCYILYSLFTNGELING